MPYKSSNKTADFPPSYLSLCLERTLTPRCCSFKWMMQRKKQNIIKSLNSTSAEWANKILTDENKTWQEIYSRSVFELLTDFSATETLSLETNEMIGNLFLTSAYQFLSIVRLDVEVFIHIFWIYFLSDGEIRKWCLEDELKQSETESFLVFHLPITTEHTINPTVIFKT